MADVSHEAPTAGDGGAPDAGVASSVEGVLGKDLDHPNPNPNPTEAETEHSRRSKTFRTWSTAIAKLDKSEVEIRDLIERGLQDIAGVSGTKYGAAMRAVDRIMVQIKRIRLEAIKASFRHIRSNS